MPATSLRSGYSGRLTSGGPPALPRPQCRRPRSCAPPCCLFSKSFRSMRPTSLFGTSGLTPPGQQPGFLTAAILAVPNGRGRFHGDVVYQALRDLKTHFGVLIPPPPPPPAPVPVPVPAPATVPATVPVPVQDQVVREVPAAPATAKHRLRRLAALEAKFREQCREDERKKKEESKKRAREARTAKLLVRPSKKAKMAKTLAKAMVEAFSDTVEDDFAGDIPAQRLEAMQRSLRAMNEKKLKELL
ncbi:uncharacterized protein LY79DRAFT_583903 [Colletotrichum navitas]|uniref:Uncharacterized protein n=1 Tax=Colletotrichum navitas TaxID=681940 RepID=A0AAD8PNJ3_9PEZI|nr:uncharacterized protein LY79DRAFT_583903 [Colletotrichum navitas]KAK1573079.1 hypothetical protein LY79DRAFT_583903 [Colletotrichum navitas]